MRLVFAGTPEFAQVALAALHAAGHEIALVLTQPDRPAGRGMALQMSAVKQFALAHGLPVAQPRSLRLEGRYPQDAAAAQTALAGVNADAFVVAAYGLILPQWTLDLPRLGCFNIHASLLPRWRGAAPIHRAIEAGDTQTGTAIMQMDAGLDTGDVLLLEPLPIDPTDTTTSLHDKLAAQGGRLVLAALRQAEAMRLQPTKQSEVGMCYAHKIEKAEAQIDWAQSAEQIERRIRAFNPFPVAATKLGTEAIKCWAAQVVDAAPNASPSTASAQVPGQIMQADAQGVLVATGQGLLRLTELQRAGGKRLGAGDFLRGFSLPPLSIFNFTSRLP
jgi:methionyl-tRNA formyltransferase